MLKRKKNDRTADGQRTDSDRTLSGARRKNDRTPDGQRRTVSGSPRWVTWFTDIGRPLSAIVVMVLCAPGERHLAELAGWGPTLSWGMAGLLVMYAGIAAVVATVRPKGAPGKRTAVLGAIVSLLLAMAAQPVSHYFVTGWMVAEPRPPFWLVTVVSCVPPFVMGHLLHLAADPGTAEPEADPLRTAISEAAQRVWEAEMPSPDVTLTSESADNLRNTLADLGQRIEAVDQVAATGEDDLSWASAARWTPDLAEAPDSDPVQGGHGQPVPVSGRSMSVAQALDLVRRTRGMVDPDTGTDGTRTDNYPSGYRDADEVSGMYPDSVDPDMSAVERTDGQRTELPGFNFPPETGQPDHVRYSGQSLSGLRPADIRSAADRLRADSGHRTDGQRTDDMSAFIRDTWALNPDMDKADMRTAVRRNFPDKGADAVRKAVTRAEEAIRR